MLLHTLVVVLVKALELSGFKSFADKTRFEFPPGITVVVGPNGSGKSNIVDAIKWVLGEQSAKSLRGKDMSDVIFKGSSGANSRRPSNSATATIVLDNSDQRFAYDADEVHVSRRVYRSGESEYLINGETSRLKDIRELFRGTGVATLLLCATGGAGIAALFLCGTGRKLNAVTAHRARVGCRARAPAHCGRVLLH